MVSDVFRLTPRLVGNPPEISPSGAKVTQIQNISGLPHGPTGLIGGRLSLRQSRRERPPMSGMGRREFVALLGGAAAAWPQLARGQQPTVPSIGFLYPGVPELSTGIVAAFRKGLGETGFSDGRNV